MAYIYRHIRLDKNEPFYVGIGSDNDYKRAHNKHKRTAFWKNITNKTPYEVEILLDDLTWEQACEKEIEFIALYGRIDLNKGTLVNMTDGGEGQHGRKISEETRIKMCKPNLDKTNLKIKRYHSSCLDYSYLKNKAGCKKGISKSKKHIESLIKSSINKRIKIFCPELNIVFNSLTEASKIINKSTGNISNILNSKNNKTREGLTLIKY
jgi:hypothetical protein